MKKLPRIVIFDYLIYSIGLFLFVILLEPFGTRNFLANNSYPYFYYTIEAISFFVFFVICDLLVTNVFNLPTDYSQPKEYQIKRLIYLAIPCILLNALFDGEYFCILTWGLDRWYYMWCNYDGSITLKYFVHDLKESIFVGCFVMTFHSFVTYSRMQKHYIEELKTLNSLLENEQERLHSQIPDSNTTDTITLNKDTRESFTVNPLDIMYVESVGNYLNIIYFNDSELCQKRIRCSLRETEEILEKYPFMVHIHRAFLVNINFISQISGNAAGYKVQLFSTDKVLPVSKANVPLFRNKLQQYGTRMTKE